MYHLEDNFEEWLMEYHLEDNFEEWLMESADAERQEIDGSIYKCCQ